MRAAPLSSLALLAIAWAPAPARAEEPPRPPAPRMIVYSAQLDVRIEAGAERCPDASFLRRLVADELGYDPFAPDREGAKGGRFSTVIARVPSGLHATTDHVDAAGVKQWTKTYDDVTTARAACESVMKGVALQIEAELTRFEDEPAAAPAPPAPPAPSPPPAPPPPPPVPEEPPRSSPPPRPRIELGGGAYASFGVGPAAAFGGLVHLGVAIFPFAKGGPWLSFAAEGRADAVPAHAIAADEAVTTSLLGGSLLACLHEEVLEGTGGALSLLVCPVGTVGSLRSSGEAGGTGLGTGTGTYAGLGARVGIEGRFGPRFALRLHGAGLATLHGAGGFSGAQEIWRTSDGTFEVGLGAFFFLDTGVR